MPRHLHALALGLLGPPPRATPRDRLQARIALALLAAEHGYALLETIETTGTPTDLGIALDLIEKLALALDVDALAVDGHMDPVSIEDLAARVRLVVLRHPDPDPNPDLTEQP
jgi:hypothetical protein